MQGCAIVVRCVPAVLHGWAAELPPTRATARLVAATARWEAITDRLGLGATRAWARALWKRAQAARFAPVEAGARY